MVGGTGRLWRRYVFKAGAVLGATAIGVAAGPLVASAAPANSGPTVASFATRYDANGHLEVVRFHGEPGGTYTAAETGAGKGAVTSEADSVVRSLGATDPMRPAQWALDRVSFESAWALTRGHGVTVAVVDTGVRADHEDLQNAVLPGKDYVSPGGNGWNDQNGHGTHVAGIIAAAASNGVGIAGAAPNVKILPVRVLDASGAGYSSNVADGVIWAADHGARVINLSLGGTVPSAGTRTAIQYANSKGAIVVAAAGNGAQQGNQAIYPAAFPEAVAIAAVGPNLTRASFSNYGAYVDLAAPGVNIRSTYNSSRTAYADMSGTSMATPYAAAAVALAAAENPKMSAAGIRDALEATAIDLGPAGADAQYGRGLINPAAAVLRSVPKPPGYGTKGNGYWVVSADGVVRAYGKAVFAGDMRGRPLPGRIVASAASKSGKGYWLAGADG